MRPRLITRLVDARAGQHRYIVWFECKHTISFHEIEFAHHPELLQELKEATQWLCPHCEDLPPPTPEERRRTMTAQQLWKEAGAP